MTLAHHFTGLRTGRGFMENIQVNGLEGGKEQTEEKKTESKYNRNPKLV